MSPANAAALLMAALTRLHEPLELAGSAVKCVHGDLRAVNIFVRQALQPCLWLAFGGACMCTNAIGMAFRPPWRDTPAYEYDACPKAVREGLRRGTQYAP